MEGMTAIDVFHAAAELGLTLEANDGHILVYGPHCPPSFQAALREHKPSVMALLANTWIMVRSDLASGIVFFANDEAARDALIAAGCSQGCVFTREELAALVAFGGDDAGVAVRAKVLFEGKLVDVRAKP